MSRFIQVGSTHFRTSDVVAVRFWHFDDAKRPEVWLWTRDGTQHRVSMGSQWSEKSLMAALSGSESTSINVTSRTALAADETHCPEPGCNNAISEQARAASIYSMGHAVCQKCWNRLNAPSRL